MGTSGERVTAGAPVAGDAPEAMTEMPWIKWLDLDTTIEADGALVVALRRPKPEHANHNHAINAPVVYGVAEVAGAGAAVLGLLDLLSGTYTVVESATIHYEQPANEGVVATGRVEAAVAARGSRRGRARRTHACSGRRRARGSGGAAHGFLHVHHRVAAAAGVQAGLGKTSRGPRRTHELRHDQRASDRLRDQRRR